MTCLIAKNMHKTRIVFVWWLGCGLGSMVSGSTTSILRQILGSGGCLRLEVAQDRPQKGFRNYLAGFYRCVAALFGPILGSRGPSLALLGGPGGHLEAYFRFGKLDLGVQGGQKLSFQKHQKT